MSLPELLDRRWVARNVFGAKRVSDVRPSVDAVFRALPNVHLPGIRKAYVRGEDLKRLLEESTFTWTDGRVV